MRISGKNVLVCGAGISGIGCLKLLYGTDAHVTLFDNGKGADLGKIREKIENNGMSADRIGIVLHELTEELIEKTDLAVLSPGIATDQPFVLRLKEAGIPVWSEIELAYECSRGTVVGITGTNGKTTTTTLTGEIMAAYFRSVFVVGNIGNSYTSEAAKTEEDSVIVAELSSFQLETIDKFRPHVAAMLNITPDHLDRHHTMEAYAGAKENIFRNQTAGDFAVLNYADTAVRAMADRVSSKVTWFSSGPVPPCGYYYKDGMIFRVKDGRIEEYIASSDIKILGVHNMENVMAAAAIAECMNVPDEVTLRVIRGFEGVEHRIEFVKELNGVTFYNDSKGTNPDAAIKAVEAMIRPTVVIGGGYDKHIAFDEWIESFGTKVKHLVLIGQTREMIADCAKAHGFNSITMADSLEEAVKIAYNHAEPGYAVLLSPACASWGMFDNYEQRGRMFKDFVRALR
ncbi:MAG: UDP-N-acetylmuramoyl-L-alanine--D-glutamate ligase [Lachnospiraceae bacterium]|nr:UDP-N-acetylmuramoyl-L-alanine--D-glutamate ligase [Lachnospiraceae bacterium]